MAIAGIVPFTALPEEAEEMSEKEFEKRLKAIRKQYRAEAWESIASVVKEAIAKNTD